MARPPAKPPSRSPSGAVGQVTSYLFVDDDERIVRFPLGAERIRIGRDQTNDIWIEHPDVQAHALLLFKRNGQDALKVYDGATVTLNGVLVTKLHRLYGGDRIGVADREFLYGRDDTRADVAIGLSIAHGDTIKKAVVLRQTRIRIGRRDADVVLDDPSVSDRHVLIEAYASDGLFVSDSGSSMGTRLDGEKLTERARLVDGAVLQVGRVTLRVHVMSADGAGLLVVPGPKQVRPRQVKTPLGAQPRRSGQQTHGGSADEASDPTIDLRDDDVLVEPEVPHPTVIGSLRDIAATAATGAEDDAPPRTRKRPRSQAVAPPYAPPRLATPQPAAMPPPPPISRTKQRAPSAPRQSQREPVDDRPSVQISPEVYERGRKHVDPAPGPRIRETGRRYAAGRSRDSDAQVPVVPPRKQTSSIHEQLTDVLDARNVKDMVGDRYVAAYQNVQAKRPDESSRYRPSKDARAEPPGGDPRPQSPFALHGQPTFAGKGPTAKPAQLTNVLDINEERPRLSREVHGLDADAMPEQLRAERDLERQRGRRDRIDDVPRQKPYQVIDDSPRYTPDDD